MIEDHALLCGIESIRPKAGEKRDGARMMSASKRGMA